MTPLRITCPRCGAAPGVRCAAGRAILPCKARTEAVADRRFITQEGGRLHRVAQHDLDGTIRSRCGIADPLAYLVPVGDSLLDRLVDCGNCARSLGSAV